MKILRTNRGKTVYRVEENADGTLNFLTPNGKHEYAPSIIGRVIYSIGGIEAVKSRCIECTLDELYAEEREASERKQARIDEWKRQHTDCEYAIDALVALSKKRLEPSKDNIRLVLEWLNKVYFWRWPEKPDFGIGYTAVQYEDEEKCQLCTCIKFDEPVVIDGQRTCKVATGSKKIIPNGYCVL